MIAMPGHATRFSVQASFRPARGPLPPASAKAAPMAAPLAAWIAIPAGAHQRPTGAMRPRSRTSV